MGLDRAGPTWPSPLTRVPSLSPHEDVGGEGPDHERRCVHALPPPAGKESAERGPWRMPWREASRFPFRRGTGTMATGGKTRWCIRFTRKRREEDSAGPPTRGGAAKRAA